MIGGMTPAPAIGVALTMWELPLTEIEAVVEVEFEMIPQPVFTVTLPLMTMDGVAVLFRAMTQ